MAAAPQEFDAAKHLKVAGVFEVLGESDQLLQIHMTPGATVFASPGSMLMMAPNIEAKVRAARECSARARAPDQPTGAGSERFSPHARVVRRATAATRQVDCSSCCARILSGESCILVTYKNASEQDGFLNLTNAAPSKGARRAAARGAKCEAGRALGCELYASHAGCGPTRAAWPIRGERRRSRCLHSRGRSHHQSLPALAPRRARRRRHRAVIPLALRRDGASFNATSGAFLAMLGPAPEIGYTLDCNPLTCLGTRQVWGGAGGVGSRVVLAWHQAGVWAGR
jgi:hypothetical protein